MYKSRRIRWVHISGKKQPYSKLLNPRVFNACFSAINCNSSGKKRKKAFDNRLISDDDIEFGQLRALLYGYS